MADKDIKIGIKTTADTSGAKAAEVALEKVSDAGKHAGNQLGGSGSGTAAAGGVAEKAVRTNKSLEQVAEGADKAGKSSRNMGGAVLEASRAFEDAQYGIRGVLNNLPGLVMMLGGTAGVAGAASVAAVAISILAPKLKELFGNGDDAKAMEDFNELLAETVKRLGAVAEKRSAAAQREWLDTLDDEEEAITRQNEILADNIRILQARRMAQLSLADAERERRKAEIDADTGMGDVEKIAAKARIDEEGEYEKAREAALRRGEQLQEKQREAAAAEGAYARTKDDAAAVGASKAGLSEAARKLEAEIANENLKIKSLEGLKAKLKEKSDLYESINSVDNPFNKEAASKLLPGVEDARRKVDDAEGASGRKARLEIDLGKVRGSLGETDLEAARKKEEVNAARIEAERARREAQTDEVIAGEEVGGLKGRYEKDRERRRIQTDQRVREAKDRDERKAEAERSREEAGRERRETEKDGRSKEQAGIGRAALNLVPKEATENFRRAVQRAADGLQNGDQGKEIEELAKLMNRLTNAVEIKGTKTQVDLSNLKERIKRLEGK